jgi:hypothetical protein
MEWLSITPEPESELPEAVAVLRHGDGATPERVEQERARFAGLISRARRRAYVRWLAEARRLADDRDREAADPRVREAARVTIDVIENHDALALGLQARRGRGNPT